MTLDFTLQAADPIELKCRATYWSTFRIVGNFTPGVGGQVGPVALREDSPLKGLGLQATRDIAQGEQLVAVPRQWCFSLTPPTDGSCKLDARAVRLMAQLECPAELAGRHARYH